MSLRARPPRTAEDDEANDRACRAASWFCRALLAAILATPAAGLAVALWGLR